MADSALRRREILAKMARALRAAGRAEAEAELLAVTKTFPAEAVLPLLAAGQRAFGENRLQEAKAKWPALKACFADIRLHLLGALQSNKAADAVALFDVIESVDRDKIARVLGEECRAQNRRPRFFAEVNIGEEAQKAGVAPREAAEFVRHCRGAYALEIEGLMCVPPRGEDAAPYFAAMRALARQAGLSQLSMGMSADYETALLCGATEIRLGSALFGARG